MRYSCHTKNVLIVAQCVTAATQRHVLTVAQCVAAATQRHVLTVAQCVAEIKDHKEQVQCMFAVIEKLPKSNYDLFERLTFHLAK